MKRYLVFTWDGVALGGWSDWRGDFGSIDECEDWLLYNSDKRHCQQIVDTGKGYSWRVR